MSENTYSWDSKMPATVESKEFAIPPIGEYNFFVTNIEKTFSKAGNPMLKVRLDLQGAEGSVFDNLVLTEKAMFKVVTFFESVGIKKKGEELNCSIGEAADKAFQQEGRCKIIHEEYNGKTQARVDKYIVLDSSKADTKPSVSAEDLDVPFEIE
jgi:hypothetical protein